MLRFAVLSIDPSIGRFDYTSLSDQARMEMLIEGMDTRDKEKYQDQNLDVCEWENIRCTDDRVTYINLASAGFNDEQFPFWYIPPHVKNFKAVSCSLHGTLSSSDLPRDLLHFAVSHNKLHGALNFKAFPQNLERLKIKYNSFHGSLVLADLPRTLRVFFANNNKFSGEISLNDLPPALKLLYLWENALTGSINIERLPESIQEIDFSGNSFTGDFRMLSFPESLNEIEASNNSLSGKVVLSKADGPMHFGLYIDNVSAVVDANGARHDWYDSIVRT